MLYYDVSYRVMSLTVADVLCFDIPGVFLSKFLCIAKSKTDTTAKIVYIDR